MGIPLNISLLCEEKLRCNFCASLCLNSPIYQLSICFPRHLDRLGNLGDIPTEMFIDLLRRAKDKATPELVQALQDENENLLCEEVDVAFWKTAVDGHILRRSIPAPGPILIKRVEEQKAALQGLIESEPEKKDSSSRWPDQVVSILQELNEIPASVGLLKATLIGREITKLKKKQDPRFSSLAAALVKRWKEAARWEEAGGSRSAGRQCAGGGDLCEADAASIAKQKAVERGFKLRTWHELYLVCVCVYYTSFDLFAGDCRMDFCGRAE
ncbi:unnamed protein product [Choristocarpus tenellus]